MFLKQFFGKLTWPTVISIAIVHIAAIFIRGTSFELVALVLIALGTMFLTWKSLENGIFIGFAEVFIGGHGHLFDADIFGISVSLRMVIFASVLFIWLIRYIRKDVKLFVVPVRDVPWLILIIAVTVGTLVGFAQNSPSAAFDDMNGYLTLLYLLPLISIKWDQVKKRALLQILAASMIWLVFFTLLLSFLFTHLDGKSLNEIYRFVRDSRLAEITLQTVSDSSGNVVNPIAEKIFSASGYWYRIFMQSQFFIMTSLLLVLSGVFFLWRGQRLPLSTAIIFSFLASIIPLSTSRSFFLGLVAGGVFLVFLSLMNGKKRIRSTVSRSFATVILLSIGVVIAWGTIVFPLPPQPDISDASFYQTSADSDRELAVSSRWQLLGPMMDEIYMSPIVGSGFGKEVTFISDDPRVRAVNSSGEWTTYRFEWGYQDIWLKMGILGLVAYGWYIVSIAQAIAYSEKKHGHAWIIFGLGAGLVLLFVASIFTPFLNHPIGIVYMLLILPFLDFEGLQEKISGLKEKRKKLVLQQKLTPVTRNLANLENKD